jgi:hypothetical protein
MPRPEFDITVDGAQWRQSKDRIGFSAAGLDFNTGSFFSDSWIDPLTLTLFLSPRPIYQAFFTSNTAPYDKYSKTDYGLGATWKETDLTGVGGSRYLQGPTSALGTAVTTTATLAKNTGMYLGFFAYSDGSDYILAEFGYAATGSVTSNTAFRLYSSGNLEVWRAGVKIAEGNVSGSEGGTTVQNKLIHLMIIPCRRREILVVSSEGNGVRAIMPDILETDTNPTITEATNFWVRMYKNFVFQSAPLKYATSGYACSQVYNLAEAPAIGAVQETFTNPSWASGVGRVYGDQSYRTGNTDAVVSSLTQTDGTTAFVANGVLDSLRVKAAMTGDGLSSPVVYGILGGYKALSANTDATESASINDKWQRLSFEVPETGGSSFTMDIMNPSATSIVGLYTHANKPNLVKLGTTFVHNGITEPVQFTRGSVTANDRVSIKSNGQITQLLKDYMFRERFIFDGIPISHATNDCVIKRLVELVGGSSSDLDLETATVTAGEIAPAKCGDFSEVADIGENAWSYLSRVMQDYLGGWWYGEYPGASAVKFTTKSPTTINAAASRYTYYTTIADAISIGGKTSDEAWRFVYRQFRWNYINPEANEIVVTGYDPRIQLPVQAVKRASTSIDPTVKPSLRPTNWVGGTTRLGLINKGLSSQTNVNAAANLLYDRCSPARTITEIVVELPVRSDATGFPIWVSDKITLDGVGDFIVSSISGAVEKDPDGVSDQWMWRPVTLILSNIVGYSNSSSFDDIVAFQTMNGQRSAIARRGFIDGSMTRLPIYARDIL